MWLEFWLSFKIYPGNKSVQWAMNHKTNQGNTQGSKPSVCKESLLFTVCIEITTQIQPPAIIYDNTVPGESILLASYVILMVPAAMDVNIFKFQREEALDVLSTFSLRPLFFSSLLTFLPIVLLSLCDKNINTVCEF